MLYQLQVSDEGSGFPVVLLHAFPLDSGMWDQQRSALLEAGFRVLTPDLPGFGASPLPDGDPDLAVAAQAVFDLLDDRAISEVTVAGLSMGGYVAMQMLREQPGRVTGLALVDTKATADAEDARANRIRVAEQVLAAESCESLNAMLPALLGPSTLQNKPDVVAAVRDWIDRADPAAVAWSQRAMAARPDSLPTLHKYQGPAMVLFGGQDTLSPVSEQDLMVAALASVVRKEVAGSGHLSALEQPEAVSEALVEFAFAARHR